MTTIDTIIAALLTVGMVMGFVKGFIRQLASVAGLIAGLIAARALYLSLAEKLYPAIESVTVAQVIAFVAIWLVVPLIFALIARLLTRAMEAVSLGCFNRWLGAALGVVKYALFIGLLIHIVEFADPDDRLLDQTMKNESVLYTHIREFTGIFFPAVKEITQQYITI